MSVPNDNDAGRLYNILEELKTFRSNSPYEAFAEIFDVEKDDYVAICEAFADILALAGNVKNMIYKLHTKKDIFYYTINAATKAICLINFIDKDNGLRAFKNALGESILAGMEFAALFMSDKFSEIKLEESILDGLQNDIDNLTEEISKSNIDDELKMVLLSNLQNINTAILKYDIFGATGLKSALEKAVGAYVLAITEKSVEADSDRAFLKKVYYKICGFSNIVSSPQTVYLVVPPVIFGKNDKINNVGQVIRNIL